MSSVPTSRREKHDFQAFHKLREIRKAVTDLAINDFGYLQTKYRLSDTGKVIKRINPTQVTRERRKLKAYKRLLNKGAVEYGDIEQAYKSWMGAYTGIMSKKQVKNMKTLFKELFGKEQIWKK